MLTRGKADTKDGKADGGVSFEVSGEEALVDQDVPMDFGAVGGGSELQEGSVTQGKSSSIGPNGEHIRIRGKCDVGRHDPGNVAHKDPDELGMQELLSVVSGVTWWREWA